MCKTVSFNHFLVDLMIELPTRVKTGRRHLIKVNIRHLSWAKENWLFVYHKNSKKIDLTKTLTFRNSGPVKWSWNYIVKKKDFQYHLQTYLIVLVFELFSYI